MSFQLNSDRETIRAIAPTLVGTQELSIRNGTGSDEKEVLRTLLDPNTDLPRVGINRTGNRIDRIVVNLGGTGYTTQPTVNIAPPPAGGTQALGTAIIDEGFVTAVLVDNPGLGYTTAPAVTITGGNGTGAQVEAFLDTVDFELDINGAIRTSTSIISDTARILNLDIDNFITPDAKFRAPDLKTYANGTGIPWSANVIVQKDAYRFRGPNVYQALNAGETGSSAPLHKDGTELNGEVNFKHIGFRVNDVSGYKYQETGESGEFPRSITPLLGDRSTKIATTEYVLNLATNDVGGRIYVSSQIGNDLNDGRSAVAPVRTIKKAAQLAWATPGVKETLIVSGGDYVEDNPISLPPDASVVGDNLRLVIIRPANPRKHIFKFGDKNYVIGVTYRDQIDSSGDAVATWDFAMVFDDKQRINYDYTVNGDFGTQFPIGTQIFGPEKFRADFQTNTGLANLVSSLPVRGVNTGAQGVLERVEFTTIIGPSAYVGGNVDFSVTSGTFTAGETFQFGGQGSIRWQPDTVYTTGQILWATDFVYTVAVGGTSAASSPVHDTGTVASGPDTLELTYLRDAYEFVSTDIRSIRAEGEVVFEDTNITDALPIVRVDFSLQGDPSIATGGFQDPGSPEDLGGIVFYTNALVGRQNTHDFKEGQEIVIEGMPTSSPDLSFLNGKQRIYKVLEDADGRARRFVIPKKTTITTTDNFDPGQFCSVRSYEKSITISLLNSPNRFPMATPIARRYQDACLQIRNNVEFIADEVVGKINDQFKKEYYSVYGIGGTPDAQFTPTNVTYDPATGDTVFTVNNHGLSIGDGVSIADQSITFTCTMDGNKTEHALPDTDQYASGKSLPITAVTTNTFTLNVGASGPNQLFTPSAATYNPSTGALNLTIGTHTLSVGEGIVIDDNSLSFTCDMDNNQSTKTYPRPGIDPFAGRSMPITEISETSITVNAGVSRPNQYFTPSAATYDASNGDLTVTVGQHGLGVGRSVVLEDNSFTFTCDQNGHATEHTYPRPGQDPYAGQSIAITAVGSTQHTVTNAVYTASNGQVDITIANHGFQEGDYIKFDDSSLTFTCNLDGNTVQKSYPRAGYDYPSGRWLPITNISTNGFRVNIGPSDYTGAHTFVSATTNGLSRQDGTFTINVGNAGTASGSTHLFVSATTNAIKHEPQSTHTFVGATSNAVRHLPQSAHTFVRSQTNSLSIGGSELKIYLGTSRFVHDYVSGGTVTFGGSTYNITNFVYDNVVTGEATITLNAPVANLSEDATVQVADILLECTVDGVVTQKVYPSFSIPVSDEKCRRDVGHFISAITRDLEYGSNYNVIDAAKKYIDGTNTEIDFVNNEIIQTVRALEYARELMIHAMRKWRTGTGAPGQPIYTPQYSSLPQYFDPTIIDDLSSPACANVASAIDTLAYLFIDVLANNSSGTYLDGAYLIARNRDLIADEAYKQTLVQYPNLALNNIDERKCRRDINHIISALLRDLVLGGNFGIVNAAEFYFTGAALTGIPASELAPTRFAFQEAKDLCIAAMRNWLDDAGNAVLTPLSDIPQFTDTSILPDPAGIPLCANVQASINTAFTLLDNILLYAVDTNNGIAPGATTRDTGTLFDTSTLITYPESTIYDQTGLRITPRSDFADNPIIEASPYTQNSSVISFLGGGGAEVDGAKVKQPNCPFPGLELDGSATFPNQGKSMVASAFTIVSFGGTGYKVINDGYTQLVSVFVIFCADGVLAESGGYCSITNSATNFGIFALRGSGFREEAYTFDVGQITNVSSTPTGRTIFTVNGLGREPLEHYVVKVDGFSNINPDIEYFVDVVEGVTVGPPFSAQLTLESGSGGGAEFKQDSTGNPVSVGSMVGETLRLHRPSIVNSSSHTWEFAGSGTNYNALPENGGTKVEAYEQVSENYGRVYVSGTDELGDFKVGTFARIENRTGAITFTGTVTISEVEFLKLKGGDVVVTGFDASNTLGGANSTDSKLPTQKAVKDYITNNLGPYLNKPYSTNPVPRALVELTDSGKISEDQIPPLRPFQVYTVANLQERVAIEGALAGDIAIQQDTSTSFILNNDNDSLFVSFPVDSTLQFTIGDVFTGSNTGGKIQATEYREGVVYQINITDGGSGYVTPPVVTLSGGNPQAGAISANATCEIANGIVVLVTIELFNGLIGGKGYTSAPVVTFAAPAGSGTQAQGNALIESRLYGDIVNNIKIEDTDDIESSDVPSETINLSRVVNTSASNSNNWVSLSSNQIAANDITSGVIATARLAFNNAAANSFSFLRGDQSYAPVIQSLKGAETRYFAKLTSQANSGSSQLIFATNSDVLLGHEVVANINGIQPNTNITGILTAAGTTTVSIDNPLTATIPINSVIEFERGQSPLTFESSLTQGDFIDSVVIAAGGSGFTDGQYFDVELTGGAGTGLKANIIVVAGSVTELTLTASGSGYLNDFTVSSAPAEIGSGSGLVLLAKLSTVNKQFANVAIDIARVSDLTISADEYGTIGVSRFYKDQFDIGLAGNGSIKLKTGADSGLDADKLDGAQGSYYLNSSHQNAGTLPVDRLSGTYNISIANQSGSTLKLNSSTSNLNSNPTPDAYNVGIIADTRNNSADGLNDGGNQHVTLTIRNGGSGFDAGLGGVRQLAFTDNDNMYIRGSGSTLATFGTWAKVWHSDTSRGGMGEFSGLDADRLDFREGSFYQNAINMNTGIFSDNRLPSHQTAKDFQDSIRVLDWDGKARYKILVRDELLTATPFLVGQQVNLYAANGTAPGRIAITEVAVNQDINDAYNNYTLITGTLVTGNFIGAIEIGTTAQSYPFQDFSIATLDANADGLVDGTFEVAALESDGGAARLKLGRNDQTSATDPSIFFRSSLFPATNYNSAIIATGGNSTDGSGSLEFKTANVNAMTLLGNILWNEGNLVPYVSNVGSAYGPNNNAWDAANPDDNVTLRSIVMRDKDGNFNAGTITANLTGAASLNVLKAGDTMSGTLIISGISAANQALSVSGRADFLSNITVNNDLTVNGTTLHVDATDDTVSIGTTSSDSAVKLLIVEDADQDVVLRMYSSYNVGGAANQRDAVIQLLGQDGTRDEGLEIKYDNSIGDVYFKQLFNSITTDVAIRFGTGAFGDNALTITGNGNLGIQMEADDAFELDVNGSARIKTALNIARAENNGGAPAIFAGATGASNGSGGYLSNFRVGNQLLQADTFEITPSDGTQGALVWKSTPALAIQGSENRVAINTLQFGGTDTTVSPQVQREYQLNIQGDININGFVFQNNAEFVTSRWTESDNELDIYRESKVWINPDSTEAGFTGDPDYDLQVGGGNNAGHLGLHGVMYVRDTPQWIDTTGIIKNSASTIAEDVTIPANANAMSIGPITIQPGITIDVIGNWNII